jgi:OOP family OmpA-OmpF porin
MYSIKKTMKKLKITLVALSILASLNFAKAQGASAAWYKLIGAVRNTTWTANAGWNIVDDNGQKWKQIFDAGTSWNCPPYPTRIGIDGQFKSGWDFGFHFSFNNYKGGKQINNDFVTSSFFYAFDANAKIHLWELYDINPLIGLPAKSYLDIYGTGGIGFTIRNTKTVGPCATSNVGFGLNAHLYKGFGIQLEAMSKFGAVSPFYKTGANYLQYTFGVIYKFKPKPVALGKRYKYKRVKPKI